MQICLSCRSDLPEEGAFCPNCGKPTRCNSCRKLLTLGAQFCANCGTKVNEAGSTQVHSNGENGVNAIGTAYNTIRFHQDNRGGCDLDAKLTDRAFEAGGEVLGLVIAARAGVQLKRGRHVTTPEIVIDDPQLELPGVASGNEHEHDPEDKVPADPLVKKVLPPGTDGETLRQIFRYNEDKLKLINTRIKATKQEDFIARLSVLFLYAHELEGRDSVSRADLKALLEDSKVYNGNARAWIAATDLLAKDDDKIGLSVPGRDYAEKFLNEFRDPSINPTWTLSGSKTGSRGSKTSSAGKKGSGENKSSKGRRAAGTSYYAQITKLVSEGFFKKKHTEDEVSAELKRRGHKFPQWRINEALVKLTKKDVLSRNENDAGKWAYQHK